MRNSRASYRSSSQQQWTSRHDPNRTWRPNERQQVASEFQNEYFRAQDSSYGGDVYTMADSWRPYWNDTAHLQPVGGLASDQGLDPRYSTLRHPPFGYTNLHGLNASAPVFQPRGTYQVMDPTQSNFTPYQSSRFSSGYQQMNPPQQTRHNSTLLNAGGVRQGILPLRGSVHRDPKPSRQPLRSIGQRSAHSSSVPIGFQGTRHTESQRPPIRYCPSPPVSPLPVPSPSREYLMQASQPPEKLLMPQKLLVVLDLNGTLLKRTASNRVNFVLRPGVTNLLDYLFSNHVVMVFSSARPENVRGMVNKLLSPHRRKKLAAVWARDTLGLTPAQYQAKVQVYKQLGKVWADRSIQKHAVDGQEWGQHNTVLIDDSHLKALGEPYNLMRIEEFTNDRPYGNEPDGKIQDKNHMDALNTWNAAQQRIVKDFEAKLEELKWTKDVSRLIRSWQLKDAESHNLIKNQSFGPSQNQQPAQESCRMAKNEGDLRDNGFDMKEFKTETHVQAVNSRNAVMNNATSDTEMDVDIEMDISDRSGSVSPIDEQTWKDILAGVESGKDRS